MKKPVVWTEGRRKSFITSVLRSGSRKWPPKYECLAAAFVDVRINKKSGRLAKHYKCNSCGELFPSSSVNVDHVEPVVGAEGFVSWDKFIENLFCPITNLQVLCTTCHDVKTKLERKKK